jgi:methylated-DNA-[protein]-cysteine S-methyltransferase
MGKQIAYYNSPIGLIRIEGDAGGISIIHLTDDENTTKNNDDLPQELKDCLTQLDEYFNNKRDTFHLKLNPKGSPFQQQVWIGLQQIPFGKSLSYLAFSRILGDEKAIRAVASANGQNPLAIVIPCHRVIGSDGSLTGYAGGLWRKEWLLKHEKNDAFRQTKISFEF